MIIYLRHFFSSYANLIIFSLLTGFGRFGLKLFSVVKLVDDIDPSHFSFALILSGVVFFPLSKFLNFFYYKQRILFIPLIYVLCLIPIFFNTFSFSLISQKLVLDVLLFVLANSAVSYFDLAISLYVLENTSLTKDHELSNRVSLFQEIGFGLAAIFSLFSFSMFSSSFLNIGWKIFPFMALLGLYLVQWQLKQMPSRPITREKEGSLPYFKNFVWFFALLFFLKYGQILPLIQGIELLKDQKIFETASIFSFISFFEVGMIISLLLLQTKFSWESNHWKALSIIYFIVNGALFLILSFYTAWPLLLFSSSLRKILENALFNPVKKLLEGQIASSMRFSLKLQTEIVGNSFAPIFLGIILLPLYSFNFSFSYLWPILAIAGFWGVRATKKLYKSFFFHHLTQLKSTKISDFLLSAQSISLYSGVARYYQDDFFHILKHSPRPLMTKTLIRMFGEIKGDKYLDYLLEIYKITDREDIKITVLQTVTKFSQISVKYFLKKELESVLQEGIKQKKIPKEYIKLIALMMKDTSLVKAYELFLYYQEARESQELECVIEILAEMSILYKGQVLDSLLKECAERNYSRGVKYHALRGLYHSKKYKDFVLHHLNFYKDSPVQEDRNMAAILVGDIEAYEYKKFVWNCFEENKRKGLILDGLILALLKLRDRKAPELFSWFLFDSRDNYKKIEAIKKFSLIEDSYVRKMFYFYVLDQGQEKVAMLLVLMKQSRKDFSEDRWFIFEQCEERHIEVKSEVRFFLESLEKKVA